MKRNFLIAIAMLLLFFSSCKKDSDIQPNENLIAATDASTSTTTRSDDVRFELTVENFFNPTYVRDYLELPFEQVVESQEIIDVMQGIDQSENNISIVSQIGLFYGMPCWACGVTEPYYDNFTLVPIISLPDANVTAIIVTQHDVSPIAINLLDRETLNKNFDPSNPKHLYFNGFFQYFDNLIRFSENITNSATTRDNTCNLVSGDINNPNGPNKYCKCSETALLCGPSTGGGECQTCPDLNGGNNGGNDGGGYGNGGGGVIYIDLGGYPIYTFSDFVNQGETGTTAGGGGNSSSSNNSNEQTWDDFIKKYIPIDLNDYPTDNNNTSFPPVQGDGNSQWNTATTDDIPLINLQQLIQFYELWLLSFYNTYSLPYSLEELKNLVTIEACGGVEVVANFHECAKIQLISNIFTELNFTSTENLYIFNNFELFPLIENLIAEKGIAYASDLTKAYIQIASSPSSDISWQEFVDLYNMPPMFSPPVLDTTIDISIKLDCFDSDNWIGFNHKFTIYVEQPDPGTRNVLNPTNGQDAGHTFCMLEQTNSSGETTSLVFGLYPDSQVKPLVNEQTPPRWVDNGNHTYNISVTWTVTPLQFNTIIEAVREVKDKNYNVNNHNCTDLAVQAGSSYGYTIPDTFQDFPIFGGGTNPADLGEDFRELTLSANMTRHSAVGSHAPHSINCD